MYITDRVGRLIVYVYYCVCVCFFVPTYSWEVLLITCCFRLHYLIISLSQHSHGPPSSGQRLLGPFLPFIGRRGLASAPTALALGIRTFNCGVHGAASFFVADTEEDDDDDDGNDDDA